MVARVAGFEMRGVIVLVLIIVRRSLRVLVRSRSVTVLGMIVVFHDISQIRAVTSRSAIGMSTGSGASTAPNCAGS